MNPKPYIPFKTKFLISLMTFFTDAVRRRDGTINRRLLSFFDLKSPPSSSSSDVTIDPCRNLWFRIYIPAGSPLNDHDQRRFPVLVYFHGGGFCFLGADTRNYDDFCRCLSNKVNAIVISVNYRLTPEHKFPSQYDDGFDVLKFIDENYNSVLPPSADVARIFLAGDSAGANLAHHLAVRSGRVSFRVVKLIGLISVQPFFGGEERTESEEKIVGVPFISVDRTDWTWTAFLGEGESRDHYAVNVSGPNAEDISGLEYPDSAVFVGGFDPLQDWQRKYYEWLRLSGKKSRLIEYPDMIHGFHIFPQLLEASSLIQDVKDFIDETVGKL